MRWSSSGWAGLALLATAPFLPAQVQQAGPPTVAKPAAPVATKPHAAEHKFVVLLDPAHGGKDPGATLATTPSRIFEKDITLEFGQRLRSAMTARGLELRLTRDDDASVSYGQRADQAGSLAPSACVTLHATSSGSGVHVFYPLPQFALSTHSFLDQWSSSYVPPSHESHGLAQLVAATLKKTQIPVTLQPAADPVLSRERCPAVVIELAPLRDPGTAAVPPSDHDYQQRVSAAVADALAQWRQQQSALAASAAQYARKVAH